MQCRGYCLIKPIETFPLLARYKRHRRYTKRKTSVAVCHTWPPIRKSPAFTWNRPPFVPLLRKRCTSHPKGKTIVTQDCSCDSRSPPLLQDGRVHIQPWQIQWHQACTVVKKNCEDFLWFRNEQALHIGISYQSIRSYVVCILFLCMQLATNYCSVRCAVLSI